ncbi:MAG: SPOR domain-containing protein, partial [Alphaproteobacteria bacterium]|nr:SPOR domain-containing protein [Alphaproteobacteria bacterium]
QPAAAYAAASVPAPAPSPLRAHAVPAAPAGSPLILVSQRPVFVQAGAYSDPANAFRVKGAIEAARTADAQVTVSTILQEGQPLYRVRIGPMPTPTDADRALRKVVALGHTGATIVLD